MFISPRVVFRTVAIAAVFGTMALAGSCGTPSTVVTAGDALAKGTWGGDNAGLIVNDSVAHVHIACTLGDFHAPVPLDANGRFDVDGSYVLRAYPVFIGPDLPARFEGRVVGNRLTLRVTVNDTVEKKTVNVGPVSVTLGSDPRMGPCPICDQPGDRRMTGQRSELKGQSKH